MLFSGGAKRRPLQCYRPDEVGQRFVWAGGSPFAAVKMERSSSTSSTREHARFTESWAGQHSSK